MMLKKNYKNLISFVCAFASIVFYFAGFFQLKDPANGNIVIDSMKMWSIGLKADASGVAEYIDFMTAGMMTAIIIALLVSIFFTVIFFVLFLVSLKKESYKTEVSLSVISILIFANFASAFIITFLFYSSSHASFAKNGIGGLSFGAYIALCLHLVAVSFQVEKAAGLIAVHLKENRQLQADAVLTAAPAWEQPTLQEDIGKRELLDDAYAHELQAIPLSDLPTANPVAAAGATALAAVRAGGQKKQGKIVFLSGQYKGTSIPITEGQVVTMGKDGSRCAVVFDKSYTSISRKHCAIQLNQRCFMIADFSKNGLYNSAGNRLHCDHHFVELKEKQAIGLAKTNNKFFVSSNE